MKVMIASDLHGSAYFCRKLIEAYRREQADRLLLLGDLLYHGPRNDLPKEYQPKQVIELLNEMKEEILCVRGNCDTEVDQMVLEFPILAEYCIIPIGKRMLFATHGHVFHKGNRPMLKEGDILLNGHFHVPACEWADGIWYMNPGSVSIPKEESLPSYMIMEEELFEWKTLDGVSYKKLNLAE